MVAKLISHLIPKLGVLEYCVDLIGVVLLFFVLIWILKYNFFEKHQKYIFALILVVFLFDICRALITQTNFILFVWGIRNQYRFMLMFFAVCIFWTIEDIDHFFKICYYLLIFNMFVIVVQFASGYNRDYLGGIFGVQDQNVNAITNVFLIILVTYGILGNVYKKVSRLTSIVILSVSVIWSALAEIKIFYVELVIIAALVFFIVRGHSLSKVKWIGSMIVFLIIGIVGLMIVFPEQVPYVTNPFKILWYLKNVHGGAHGFGRTTALRMTNEIFFGEAILPKVIGIGVGNAEFLKIGGRSIASTFYDKYSIYMYFGYFHSMVYIERGVFGLIWYGIFWIIPFVMSIKLRKYQKFRLYSEYLIAFLVCVIIVALKDSTLRISTAGYLVSVMMAIPYLLFKHQKVEVNSKTYIKI